MQGSLVATLLILFTTLWAGCVQDGELQHQRSVILAEQPGAERFIDISASDLAREKLQPLARALASESKSASLSPEAANTLDAALRRIWDQKYAERPQNWVTVRHEGRYWEVSFAS